MLVEDSQVYCFFWGSLCFPRDETNSCGYVQGPRMRKIITLVIVCTAVAKESSFNNCLTRVLVCVRSLRIIFDSIPGRQV